MSTTAALQMLTTSVQQSKRNSVSLRTTIPETYVNMLRLKAGDKLTWDHEITDGEIIIKIRKAKV